LNVLPPFSPALMLLASLGVACASNRAAPSDAGSAAASPGDGLAYEVDSSVWSDGGAREDALSILRGGMDDGGEGGDGNFGSGDTGALGDASAASGDPTGVTAVVADDFLASIGVCTHVAQGIDAPGPAATALSFAGIRNVRDDGSPAHIQDWISMHKSAGIRVCLLTNHDVTSTIDMAKQLKAAGALLAIEGANEPNNFSVTYQAQTSSYTTTFLPVARLQRDLYAAVKGEPTLLGVPVFHSSEAGGSEPDNVGLQFLTIPNGAGLTMPDGTKYADYANVHNYVCGHNSKLVDNVAWNASDPTLNGDWDGPYVEYGHTWHGGFAGYSNDELIKLPRVTTETGWQTSGMGAITEEQQGRLFLNLYLSAFKRGFAYTFVYMLRDDPNQGYWGLFDTTYKPKKSATYLHNLTTILSDAGSMAPGKLGYSIAAQPTTVHDLLLQKSSGVFELVLWDERPSGGSDSITVDLSVSRTMVTVYDPTVGAGPSMTLRSVSSVALTLSDHPMVLELQ
jgi:hypothetical protein